MLNQIIGPSLKFTVVVSAFASKEIEIASNKQAVAAFQIEPMSGRDEFPDSVTLSQSSSHDTWHISQFIIPQAGQTTCS